MKDSLSLPLICPDCSGKITETLTCPKCGRHFETKDNIIDLLPSDTTEVDASEETFWATDNRDGINAYPLLTLARKGDVIMQVYEQVLPKLKLKGKVLEVGSGTGWLGSLIKQQFPDVYLVSTDVSHSALIKGQQVNEFLHTKTDRSVTCKAERLPFEDNYFDFVIGCAMLHHTQPDKAVPEIYRVLKNGGCYIGGWELAIPKSLSGIWGRVGGAGSRAKRKGVHEGNYSYGQWAGFFKEAGFADIYLKLERDPDYKHFSWFSEFYYICTSWCSEGFMKRFLACNLEISAKKP